MERETGIEPATSSLGSWRSTAELLPLTNEILSLTAQVPRRPGISRAGSAPAKRLNLESWRPIVKVRWLSLRDYHCGHALARRGAGLDDMADIPAVSVFQTTLRIFVVSVSDSLYGRFGFSIHAAGRTKLAMRILNGGGRRFPATVRG